MSEAKVMIIESDPATAKSVHSLLDQLGHEVVEMEHSTEKTLAQLTDLKPDVVMVDLSLAGQPDAMETARIISQEHDTPVIMISNSFRQLAEVAESAESYAYLTKPIAPASLYVTIRMAISKHRSDRLLKLSEAKFRAAFENANIGMAILGLDGKFERVNDQLCAMLGYSEEELMAKTFVDITHPGDLEISQEAIRGMLVGEVEHVSYQKRYILQNGQVAWVELCTSLVRDLLGEPLYFITHIQDITTRKDTEERLAASEEFNRRIIETSRDCIKVLDLEGRLQFMSPGGQRILEIEDLSTLLNQPFVQLWQKADQPAAAQALASALDGVSSGYKAYRPTAKGAPKWWDVEISPITDAKGAVSSILAVSHDVTERMKIENELRASLEQNSQSRREIEALLRASRVVLEETDLDSSMKAIFDICKGLLGAQAGFLALADEKSEYLDLFHIDTGEAPCSIDVNQPIPMNGLCQEAALRKMPVYENDFPSSRWRRFMPAGHVKLNNVMSAPLLLSGKTYGLLGLANKQGGFGENDARLAAAFTELASVAFRNFQNQESLEQSEQRYREFVESTEDLVTRVDPKGKLLYVSPSASKIFGMAPEDCVGRSAFDFVHPDDRESNQKAFADWVRKKITNTTFTNRQMGANGEVREMMWNINLHYDSQKNLKWINSIARDVTKQRKAERALARSEALLRDTGQVANVGGWELDLKTRQVAWTDEVYKIHELEPGTPMDLDSAMSFYPTHSHEVLTEAIEKTAATGESYDLELEFQTAKGRRLWVRAKGQAGYRDNEVVRLFGVFQDITERKRAEKELSRRAEFDAAAAQLSRALLVSVSIDEMAELVMQSAMRLTESRHGYVGYIDRRSGHLIAPTMPHGVWDARQAPDKPPVFEDFCGLWGGAHDNREPILSNQPAVDPRPNGVRQGRISITRFISVPAIVDGQLRGQVVVANAERDYTDHDLKSVERLASLYALALARKQDEEDLQKTTHDLAGRVKELGCLYGMARLMEDPAISQSDFFQKVVDLIPPSLRYPEFTCARIVMEGREYVTSGFQPSLWHLAANIKVRGARKGMVEVYCAQPAPKSPAQPFSREERQLIEAVALRLGQYLERLNSEEELARYREHLEELVSERTKALETSKKSLTEAQRMAHIGNFSQDVASGRHMWSDEFYRIFGYAPGEITPDFEVLLNHIHSDDQTRFLKAQKAVLETGQPWNSEYRMVRIDGTMGQVNLVAHLVRDQNGRALRIQGVAQDITERKRTESVIKKRVEQLAVLNALAQEVSSSLSVDKVAQAGVKQIVKSLDPDLAILFIRQGDALKMMAYGPHGSTLKGKEIADHRVGECLCGQSVASGVTLFALDIRNDPRCTWLKCEEAGFRSAATLPLKSGEEVIGVLLLASREQRDFSSQVEYLETLCSQISIGLQNALLYQKVRQHSSQLEQNLNQLQKARRQITESKSRLQAVFDGIAEPLIMLNKQARVQVMNKAASDYCQVNLSNVVGQPCHQAIMKRAEPCEDCQMMKELANGRSASFERKGLMDPERLEQVVVYPLAGDKGEASGMIMRISDITEARNLERQLIHSEKMASLGLLVSGIAHEINNPNNFITFNLPILRDYLNELVPMVDERMQNHPDAEILGMTYPELRKDIFNLLDNIQHGSDRISSIVSELREFSQRKDKSERVKVPLAELVNKGLTLCQGKVKGLVKSFEVIKPETLPEVETVPNYLEQILINLLVNAAQACDKEDSWVRLEVKTKGASGKQVIIEVSDNGTGMDEYTRHKIYDPFFTTKDTGEGTGLGLYVSRNLVESLGAKLDVESTPGVGTTFRLSLAQEDQS